MGFRRELQYLLQTEAQRMLRAIVGSKEELILQQETWLGGFKRRAGPQGCCPLRDNRTGGRQSLPRWRKMVRGTPSRGGGQHLSCKLRDTGDTPCKPLPHSPSPARAPCLEPQPSPVVVWTALGRNGGRGVARPLLHPSLSLQLSFLASFWSTAHREVVSWL